MITDGQDNMSEETLQEASRRLQQANGPTLYAVGLLGSGLQNSGREALQQMSKRTVGWPTFPETINQVDNITRTVAHDIRSQYMIALGRGIRMPNRNTRPSGWKTHAPGYRNLMVRTKTGHYSPEPAH